MGEYRQVVSRNLSLSLENGVAITGASIRAFVHRTLEQGAIALLAFIETSNRTVYVFIKRIFLAIQHVVSHRGIISGERLVINPLHLRRYKHRYLDYNRGAC